MRTLIARLLGRAQPVVAEARPGDAAAFSALHAVSFRRGWGEGEMAQLLLDPAVLAHRISLGRKVAGFILSRRAADEAEILSVAVEPRQRGRGLARAMLEQHLRQLAGIGVATVFLEVDEANAAARRLYAGAGFEQVGVRESYYAQADGKHSSALVLRRSL
jgi:ribosomal-protein-alanine N-acetyltransferase